VHNVHGFQIATVIHHLGMLPGRECSGFRVAVPTMAVRVVLGYLLEGRKFLRKWSTLAYPLRTVAASQTNSASVYSSSCHASTIQEYLRCMVVPS
jgi:hypothetical protein